MTIILKRPRLNSTITTRHPRLSNCTITSRHRHGSSPATLWHCWHRPLTLLSTREATINPLSNNRRCNSCRCICSLNRTSPRNTSSRRLLRC